MEANDNVIQIYFITSSLPPPPIYAFNLAENINIPKFPFIAKHIKIITEHIATMQYEILII